MQLDYLKTTKEVAKILGCTSRNVSLMVNNGKLKPIKILENKNFLFNLNDVLFYQSNHNKK
jgi:hypothetical protein